MHTIQDEVKLEILTSLVNKEISFNEAMGRIGEAKSWKATKEVFLKEVNAETWQEAEEQYPCHTQKQRLLEFNIKPQQAVSETFKVYMI